MKLHILSDLHFEFGKWPKRTDVNAIDADVTILAGDIGVGLQGLEWAFTINRPVIYVMGNHEFYGQRPMDELWRKAREKVAGTHVRLLENESTLIEDPNSPGKFVRFLGATLWTDFNILGSQSQEQCMQKAADSITDYSTIFISRTQTRKPELLLTPCQTLSFHRESRRFLEKELARRPTASEPVWKKTVVVTHHAPSAHSLANQVAQIHDDAAYASCLDYLVPLSDLWVHGHTHLPVNYATACGRGRVVSNPRGYRGHEQIPDFEPSLRIVLDT